MSPAPEPTDVDTGELTVAVSRLCTTMRSHAGGVELERVEGGAVHVRFTGMCCGCPYKALTWRATVEPALLAVPGVLTASAPGVRISEQALARLAAYEQEVQL